VEEMTDEQRRDAAYRIAQTTTHAKAIELIVLTKLASDAGEADQLIRDGEEFAATQSHTKDVARLPIKRLPRYDPIMQEAEDGLAKRFGRRVAQEMIDDEERLNSGKGR
jgi:hypothetical protein